MEEDRLFQNLEAEQSVLGLAIIYPKECLRKVCDLPNEVMSADPNRVLLDCLKHMEAEKSQIDMVTVADWLTKHQKQTEVSISYLAQICDTIGPSFLPGHMKIIQECYSRRKQNQIGHEYIRKLGDGDDPDECREWMLVQLKDLNQYKDNGLISLDEAIMRTYDQLDQDQAREDKPSNRIFSGISTMDNKLGGLTGSEYVAIGARPSVGKSIFALTYCLNAAKQKKRVLLVSLEMNEVQITKRIMSSNSGVPLGEMESGNMADQSWVDLANSLVKISGLPLWYSLEADTIPKLRRAAYEIYENGGLDMIAVDYIQLMTTGKDRQNRQEEISEISRGLRRLSAELKIPILVLTQLNRNSAKGQSYKGQKIRQEPSMSEARESGSIEQDANIFMLLHDPEEAEMRNEEEKEVFRNLKNQGLQMMRIIIDKNRQGKRGRVTLAFDGDHMRFLPIARDATPPPY